MPHARKYIFNLDKYLSPRSPPAHRATDIMMRLPKGAQAAAAACPCQRRTQLGPGQATEVAEARGQVARWRQ